MLPRQHYQHRAAVTQLEHRTTTRLQEAEVPAPLQLGMWIAKKVSGSPSSSSTHLLTEDGLCLAPIATLLPIVASFPYRSKWLFRQQFKTCYKCN